MLDTIDQNLSYYINIVGGVIEMMKMIMMVIKCVSAFPGLGWTPCHQMCALPLHLQVLLIIRIII